MNRRAVLQAAAACGLAPVLATFGQPAPRVIPIVARKFEFVPDTISVARGEAVILELTAPEVPMGLNLPDFDVRADAVPGKTVRLAFTPDKVGTFYFACDVFCGSGHEDMSGTLEVTEPRASAAGPRAAPAP